MCARGWRRRLATAALVGFLFLPAQVRAQDEQASDGTPVVYAADAFDMLVLRPLGLAACVVGAGFFPAAALLAAPGGRDAVEEAWEVFVLVPGKRVFATPLGEF